MIAWHAASNWCVQFCLGSVHFPAAVNLRERGIPASSRKGTAADGHVDQGQRSERASIDSTFSPSWRSVTTKWWKSSCRLDSTTPGSSVTTRIRRR